MKRTSTRGGFVLMGFISVACLTLHGNSRLQEKTPVLVLEAKSVTHANGGLQINELVIRLTSDGKAEWEEYVNIDKNQHKSARIPPEQVISIRQRLDAIDKSGFKPQMGPYASYVDVWIELSVELGARNEVLRFSITNPWVPKDLPPPPVRDKYKPMPMEVKSIVCEIDRLRAELTKQPVQEMCESSQKPNK